MGTLNKTVKNKVDESSHLNFMNGRSWDINDPHLRLQIASASCFFGEPQYYRSDDESNSKRPPRGVTVPISNVSERDRKRLRDELKAMDLAEWRSLSPAALIEKSIDEALDADVEKTLQIAANLRDADNIRTTPQVIMVRAARHPKGRGTGLIVKYAEKIMRRLDEPAVQLAYHIEKFGKDAPIPNALKKAWRKMLEGSTEYGLAKYRMESRAVKLVDIVNLVHPKSAVVDKLVKGELKTTGQTWEAIISAKGSNKDAWAEAIDVMGHMALLRNVRNLLQKGVDTKVFVDKLVEGAKNGKQLPFRYWSAYKAVEGGDTKAPAVVLDAIESCLMASVDNLPEFKGRVMSLCDNSGSALGAATSELGSTKVATIGNLTGVLTGMRAEDGHVGIFGDGLQTFAVRKKSSVFDQLAKAEALGPAVGGGTENGIWIFFDTAIKKKEHWDHIFIYSDMQAGHGGLYGLSPTSYRDYAWSASDPKYIDVAKLANKYRSTVNPKVMIYMVQIAGQNDTIIPEFYERTYILGGWSAGVIRFAAEMDRTMNGTPVQQ